MTLSYYCPAFPACRWSSRDADTAAERADAQLEQQGHMETCAHYRAKKGPQGGTVE